MTSIVCWCQKLIISHNKNEGNVPDHWSDIYGLFRVYPRKTGRWKYHLGSWGEFKFCPDGQFAVAIKPKVHLLKLQSGRNTPYAWFNGLGLRKLADIRKENKEETGLTDLILVCEDQTTELQSLLSHWHSDYTRETELDLIGHVYQSNDADCSANGNGNYIQGARMQYNKYREPQYEPQYVNNFAISCTRDYADAESVLRETVVRDLPEIAGGKKYLPQNSITNSSFPVQFDSFARPVLCLQRNCGVWSNAQVHIQPLTMAFLFVQLFVHPSAMIIRFLEIFTK